MGGDGGGGGGGGRGKGEVTSFREMKMELGMANFLTKEGASRCS